MNTPRRDSPEVRARAVRTVRFVDLYRVALGPETGVDVAEALPVRELGEGHASGTEVQVADRASALSVVL